ncbi:MAG: hypothetical protein ACLGQH_09450 [Acidobacteriota bacterium]
MRVRVALLSLAVLLLGLPALALAQGEGIPKLTGTWESTGYHLHSQKNGFIQTGEKAVMVITEQQDRVFAGTVRWSGKVSGEDAFSGVIDVNNVNFYLAGHTDGLRLGRFEGPDRLIFFFLAPGGDNPRAGYVEYRRVR